MSKVPVILIFDVGKTNKKLLLFDECYKLVYEESRQLTETKDEDDFACEDVTALTQWVTVSFSRILEDDRFDVKAINVSAYGASFVYLDNEGTVMLPLYNYLKPFPQPLSDKFYEDHGGEPLIGKQTASPSLGNLNSGLQLYRLKYEKSAAFTAIKFALHLPQYLIYILCGKTVSDITSIGCHTYLWHFEKNSYHTWVKQEGIDVKLPPISASNKIAGQAYNGIPVGVGLHDSSAALVPYLASFNEPFILLSTGTWSISLNPFNQLPLSGYELENDCLCYLSFEGKLVKASRLFAGYEHEQQVKKLAVYFSKPVDYFTMVQCDTRTLNAIKPALKQYIENKKDAASGGYFFGDKETGTFSSYEEAYHYLVAEIIVQQVKSTNLILQGTYVKKIFVDGGFSKNPIYMKLLADVFPTLEIFAASVPQASALGAAMAIHRHWNNKELPSDMIDLTPY